MHLERLRKGSEYYQLKLVNCEVLTKQIFLFLEQNSTQCDFENDHYLRIINSINGLEMFILAFDLNSESFVSSCTFVGEREDPFVKSTNINVSNAARRFANEKGCYEALLIDNQGYLREGAWSNIFWIDKDYKWFTPKNRILHGVTRSLVLDCLSLNNISCIMEDILLDQIIDKIDSAFICNSLQGLIQLKRIDDFELPNHFNLNEFKVCFEKYQKSQMENLC